MIRLMWASAGLALLSVAAFFAVLHIAAFKEVPR